MHVCKCISFVLLGAILLTLGCATKAPPSLTDIHAWSGTLTNVVLTNAWRAGATQGAIRDDWLSTFNDEQLSQLVAEAMTNNTDLRVASARVEKAGEYVELAQAALRPAINLAGTGGFKAGGGSDVSSALQGIMLAVSWEPDLWGRMRYGRNAVREDYASAKADFEFARQSLAATTARSWFAASETLLQQTIIEDTIKASESLLSLTQKRYSVGSGSQQDVTLARANLITFQERAVQIRLAHDQSLRALELLVGRYPSAELKARRDLPAFPGPVPAGLPLATLERRPDLVGAERRVAAAFNRVGEAKAARLPRLVLSASGAAVDSDVLQLKEDYENPSLGAGARLIAPLYQGGALNTQVRIRTIEQKQAVADYARMALRAITDVENALAASNSLSERSELLEKIVAENLKGLEFAQASYRIGAGDLRSVQEQQIAVYNSRIALIRAQSERLVQRVNLHLALGGSFEMPQPAAPGLANNGG